MSALPAEFAFSRATPLGGDLVEDVVVLAEEGIRGARVDQTQDPGSSADQCAGMAVGSVTEYGDGIADPVRGGRCDGPGTVVDDVTDHGRADARVPGHVHQSDVSG